MLDQQGQVSGVGMNIVRRLVGKPCGEHRGSLPAMRLAQRQPVGQKPTLRKTHQRQTVCVNVVALARLIDEGRQPPGDPLKLTVDWAVIRTALHPGEHWGVGVRRSLETKLGLRADHLQFPVGQHRREGCEVLAMCAMPMQGDQGWVGSGASRGPGGVDELHEPQVRADAGSDRLPRSAPS